MTVETEQIPLFKVAMAQEAGLAVTNVLESGYIGEGRAVRDFEAALEVWLGVKGLAVNSCTSALHLALRLAGVEAGSEVISTPMTCLATNLPILSFGARIVWADINPLTGNIDYESIQSKITSKTKAIMIVDYGGLPADIAEINRLAHARGLKVIEDAAQAFGSLYQLASVGHISDFVCFSFQAIKLLTCGDGGFLVCNDPADHARAKKLRWYGIERMSDLGISNFDQDVTEYGYKFHMNNIAASIGLANLPQVAGHLVLQRANAAFYDSRGLRGPYVAADRRSNYYLYTLRHPKSEALQTHLSNYGIASSKAHRRNDQKSVMKPFACDLPGVDEFSQEELAIPVGWWVTPEQRAYIADVIERFG